MKKNTNIEDKIQSMQEEIDRLEMLNKVVHYIEDGLLHQYMDTNELTPTWNEKIEENGEEKTIWHWATYEEDEDGNTVYYPPKPDGYDYKRYVTLSNIIAQIKALA